MSNNYLTPTNLDQAFQMAEFLSKSTIVPKDYQRNPANVLVAIQWGSELGMQPLQAMQSIAVINGKPGLYGDSLIALVQGSHLCEYVSESFDEATMTATCRAKRKDEPVEAVVTFSQADATTANLWGKQGPWKQYPKRMLQMRARAFALRDKFADVLSGLGVVEELQDYPESAKSNQAKDITPPPPPKKQEALEQPPEPSFNQIDIDEWCGTFNTIKEVALLKESFAHCWKKLNGNPAHNEYKKQLKAVYDSRKEWLEAIKEEVEEVEEVEVEEVTD